MTNPNPNGWGSYPPEPPAMPDLTIYWKLFSQQIVQIITKAITGFVGELSDPETFLKTWGQGIEQTANDAASAANSAIEQLEAWIGGPLGGLIPASAISGLPANLTTLTNVQQDLTDLQSIITGAFNPGQSTGLFPGPSTFPGSTTFPSAASNADVQTALTTVLAEIQSAVPNAQFQQLLNSLESAFSGGNIVGSTITSLTNAITLSQNNLLLQAAQLVTNGVVGVGAAGGQLVGNIQSIVINTLAGILGGSGAPAANQTPVTNTGSSAVSTGQVQPPGGEKFHISLAGATSGMTPPAKGDTGQAVTWSPYPGTTTQFGALTSGDGAFWCQQNTGNPCVTYLSTQLTFPVEWVYGKFQFTNNSKSANDMTFALAIVKETGFHGPWGASTFHMPLHFWTTPFSWAYTLWDSNNGGQIVLAQGNYAQALTFNVTYTMSAKLVGGGVALYTLPNGVTGRITDPRIDSFEGPTAFIESYNPNANDNQVSVIDFQCGSDFNSAIS